MKKKIEELTGAVGVDADITPTLREPINKVDANDWSEMNTTELWEQKATLMTRMSYAQQIGHPALISQLKNGIARIDQLLTNRSNELTSKLI